MQIQVKDIMRDMSWNLPWWARMKGYSLKGQGGAYGTLYLIRNGQSIKTFDYRTNPNIFEMEDIVRRHSEEFQGVEWEALGD